MNELFDLPLPILGTMIIVVLLGLCVYVMGLNKKWGILFPYALMLLFSSMALPIDWNDRVKPTVWLPIQQQRSMLFLATGISACLVVLVQFNQLKGKSQSAIAWTILIANFYAAMMRFLHEGPVSGLESVFFASVTLIPLLLVPAIVIRELDDFKLILRAIVLSNVVWVGMVLVQIAVNPTFITMGNSFRFVGLLANPQHAGVLLPHICLILIWLILNDSGKLRIFYLLLVGINGVFLLWTGSRTGMGMLVIGLCAILYSKAGRAIFLLPIAMILAYIGLKFMTGVIGNDIGLERLTSTDNTRDESWRTLIQHGMENPMVGVGTEGTEKSENSWLYGFASYGAGMLAILVFLTLIAFTIGLKWFRARFSLDPYYRPLLDLCIGGVAMFFAGAVLEGYIVSRVSASLCLIPIYCGAGAIFCRVALRGHVEMYDPDDLDPVDWDAYGDELQPGTTPS
ncbi:MAG: hypothetical protein R3B67_04470 [Phycisphaerales bacterium]